MSRTLIREGLYILKEMSQRGLSPSYSDRSRDTPRLKTFGFPGAGVNFGIDRPQSLDIEKFAREAGNDKDFKGYRDEIKREDGSVNIHHGSNDSGYVEFNRNNYAKPYGPKAKRHEREILDAGGIRTSSGSILFQDPFQQERSFNKVRNTLSTKPKPNRAK